MSSTYASLRGLFPKIANHTTTTSIATKTLTAKPPKPSIPSKTLVAKSHKPPEDPKIQYLVENFKEYCASPRFRRRLSVYEHTVRRFVKAKNFSAVRDILEYQKQYPDIKKESFAVRLISLYGKAKMFDEAHKLFDDLPNLNCERTVLSFNGLLGAYLNSNKYGKVRELFHKLPENLSVKPNIISYNTLIKAFCEMGSLDSVLAVLEDMGKSNIHPNVVTFNTVLDAFYSNKRFFEAEKLWELMEEKNVEANVRTYNSKLRGLVKDNRIMEAVDLIEYMDKNKVVPDTYSYNALLKAFINEGNMEEATRWFRKMEENECPPDIATLGMLIPFACDKEVFDYAYELCKKALQKKVGISDSLIQRVVDGLVGRSKVEQANKLVTMSRSHNHKQSSEPTDERQEVDANAIVGT